ncbi:MAG: hypothetical protein FWC00_02405 [Firmicutes bacterium]|nr:hypothetical protein [Bacillota bacterium]
MDEIKRVREDLPKLYNLVNRLNHFVPSLPSGVFTTDMDDMLEKMNYLMGYLDCMLEFRNETKDLT